MNAIRVNDVEIGAAKIAEEMQYHPAPSAAEAQRAAAEALVVRELLRQEARAQGFGDGDEATEDLLEAAVATPEPDDASCRRYYEANRKRFRSPDLVEVQHILVAAAPDEVEERARAKAKAEELARRVMADPAAFAALAREHSACPSKENGGRLGQIGRGSLVPELETYIFAMKAGETCPVPVASRYGWHVVRVIERADGRELPFESVRETIADYLTEASWRRAVSQYISLLAGRAAIQGIALRAAHTPLVQ
ncbi:MAG: peptidyl-prolyl cis-trans isomerase [Candidatus Odyssella sp.]|nr:peptidyl-prolyl cis-trans isomerase [Candidatus Odyssella sp.]